MIHTVYTTRLRVATPEPLGVCAVLLQQQNVLRASVKNSIAELNSNTTPPICSWGGGGGMRRLFRSHLAPLQMFMREQKQKR